MTTERVNPFADLSDFETRPPTPPAGAAEVARIDQLAEEHGFPSRQPVKAPAPPASKPRRRYTTGRNQQLNIKATAETIERIYRLADAEHVPLGALLERALDALERERAQPGSGPAERTPSAR